MKRIITAALVLFMLHTLQANAQSYEVPKDYVLKAREDYPKYEGDVVKAIDWIEATPWNEQADKRAEAKTFLLKWIEGSPSVSLNITSGIVKLAKNDNELLGSYMYGYTKYVIQHKADFKEADGQLAGVRGIIAKYNMEKGRKKNGDIEKAIKADKEGKLAEWAASNLK